MAVDSGLVLRKFSEGNSVKQVINYSFTQERNPFMKRGFMLAFLVISILFVAPSLAADPPENSNMAILLEKVRADKKLLIASGMNLTEEEAKAFWPLYDQYQKRLEEINKYLGELITEYAKAYNAKNVTNELAAKLIKEVLKAEGAEVKLKWTYADKFGAILPAIKVARYIQMENKIRAAVRFDLARNIPLLE